MHLGQVLFGAGNRRCTVCNQEVSAVQMWNNGLLSMVTSEADVQPIGVDECMESHVSWNGIENSEKSKRWGNESEISR